ncbi:hypothetical protein CathTA2_1533 [Caldalkalibacillus thermarum TA2.A1]|uniref:Uncharacterized protein n=1 Tax=Caldalkalibacillus thermarum (strain TA2.A1) TaxID=986075 RepID=F5L6T3_CALTT|nr:hypothetical protein CathTA2_1533 [Caldalkalibacillus thermarum TA2.A1]
MLIALLGGGIAGFCITALIFLLTFWFPAPFKLLIVLLLGMLFILYEFKVIRLNLPQFKWQIPASWLRASQTKNMMVWGFILGAGFFTYVPYTTFYMLYVYIGIFEQPYSGLLFGMVYGLSRTLPTLAIVLLRKMNVLSDEQLIKRMWRAKNAIHAVNGVMLILVVFHLMMTQI